MNGDPLDTHDAVRYLVPLREGGSLPAVVETERAGLFVAKFRGAGQGAKALIAEVVVASLAQAAGLPVPEVALIELSPDFARTEPDPEIQDILSGSRGLNFGIRYLDGALNFDPVAAGHLVTSAWATRLVWLDAMVTNLDRTARNPNLLVWEDRVWLIDHGAAIYAHHDWSRTDGTRTRSHFPQISSHVLLDRVDRIHDVDAEMAGAMTEEVVQRALERVPDAWLLDPVGGREFDAPDTARARYLEYFLLRMEAPRGFVDTIERAVAEVRSAPPSRTASRR